MINELHMAAPLRFLDHGGEMAERIRAFDWATHPFGQPEAWCEPLRVMVDTALASSFPTAIYWGPDLRLLYNDAWMHIPADRHPWSLGRPGAEVWADIWDVVGEQMAQVVETGRGYATFDQLLRMERGGVPRDSWWNYSLTPIRDADGRVLGILNQGSETTRAVLAERDRQAEVDRLRDYFQQAPGAVALLEGPAHRFVLANPAYLELVGRQNVVGRALAEAIPEVVAQGYGAVLDQVYRSGEPYSAINRDVMLQRRSDADAERRVLDFSFQPIKDGTGACTGIFVAAADITERAAAEEALRRSEERLQLALNASTGIGTWDWTAESGRISGDERFAALFGIDADRVAYGGAFEAVLNFIHPEDRARIAMEVRQAVAERAPLKLEFRVVRGDGAVRWLLTQGRCTFDADGRPIRFPGVAFDITDRKLAEEAAQEAADELRTATEAQSFLHNLAERQRALDTPDAIMELTAAELAAKLGLARVGFYRVVGDKIHLGPGWNDGTLPSFELGLSLDAIAPLIPSYREGRTVVVCDSSAEFPGSELSRISPSAIGVPLLRGGQWVATFYANAAGARTWRPEEIAFLETVVETTWDSVERADAVLALRKSEAQFRAITNSIDHMVWSADANGLIDYYNDRWYEYTGVAEGSTDGDAWSSVLHPDDQSRAWATWEHCVRTGDLYRIEYRMRNHRGSFRWALGRAQALRDENGRIVRWFGTCTDIQEIVDAREVLARSREELEAAVRERTERLMAAEAQLRQAQKMEAVGQLTGGIAHDFNNMLAVVIGALDLMERRIGQGRTDIERYLVAARDGASRAAALTQRLLAFSRRQPLAPTALDVNDMLSGMIELLVRTLGEGVVIETWFARQLEPVVADRNQLENVVLNLAVNGRDAMPQGGTLTIETEQRAIDSTEAARHEIAPGDYVEIRIRDTGTGMPADVAARAFDPFFTTKGVGKGTGLGLSQVFGFVRQSGGHVTIDSEPGRGTCVCVLLPSRPEAVPSPAATATERELPRGRANEVILVVEDEDRVRTFSVEALRELGYGVVFARDGIEALRLLERGQKISLLFSDVVMPEMSGRELAARVRQRMPGLKVLLTSGYAPDAPAEHAGDNILPKPFDIAALAVAIRTALDG
ncbi:PAS domain-containing protein [Sphingomonas sp. R1]|uniref:PAS domain-containing protein n=1 Tax=Sphingomonas sp. R1 TaxID=399176 RepID=UPI0022244FB7|nr:PAS domain-containing protein [Sphingomonas sp. R1]UYY76176.1 PAS domain-containing protein [Sphingomonas sp. R1]